MQSCINLLYFQYDELLLSMSHVSYASYIAIIDNYLRRDVQFENNLLVRKSLEFNTKISPIIIICYKSRTRIIRRSAKKSDRGSIPSLTIRQIKFWSLIVAAQSVMGKFYLAKVSGVRGEHLLCMKIRSAPRHTR